MKPGLLRMPALLRRASLIHVLLAIMVGVGLLLADDYGVSWDEPDQAIFGQQALQAYRTGTPPAEWYAALEPYGPFYSAFEELVSPALAGFWPEHGQIAARKFVGFLSLPLAVAALYSIVKHVTNGRAAFAAALLFSSQPLLFGHAFINPKDVPFLAFFLLSMATGIAFVYSLVSNPSGTRSAARIFAAAVGAGLVLGLATSIRLFAPFAGVLVTVLGFVRHRARFTVPAVVYWLTAAGVTYLTWPYLWGDPLGRFGQSVQTLLNFPWDNLVLYRGLAYPEAQLPWHYLPFTMTIQLTEPLILASVGGALWAATRSPARSSHWPIYGALLLWTLVPVVAAIALDASVYDNSRQFLFVLPPLFASAGMAFEALFERVRKGWIQGLAIAIVILPGLVSIARLHPYSYIYYNALVGGVPGAFRNYELDYWATSYRPAIEFLNRIAPTGSTVRVAGPSDSAAWFARPDLHVVRIDAPPSTSSPAASFLIVTTRTNQDRNFATQGVVLTQIEVEGVVLAVVRSIPVSEEGTIERVADHPPGEAHPRPPD